MHREEREVFSCI